MVFSQKLYMNKNFILEFRKFDNVTSFYKNIPILGFKGSRFCLIKSFSFIYIYINFISNGIGIVFDWIADASKS